MSSTPKTQTTAQLVCVCGGSELNSSHLEADTLIDTFPPLYGGGEGRGYSNLRDLIITCHGSPLSSSLATLVISEGQAAAMFSLAKRSVLNGAVP